MLLFLPPAIKGSRESNKQRGARAVEGARLESVYMGNCIEGSNPFLSALKT